MAHFYGWTHEYINQMEWETALEYYDSIEVIEAQQGLIQLTAAGYVNAPNKDRNKIHRSMRKIAHPRSLRKKIEFDEFIERMKDGG